MPRVHDARQGFAGEHEIREGFVVLEQGVEPRPVFADQLTLEHEGFLRRRRDDAFNVVCPRDEFGNHGPVRG